MFFRKEKTKSTKQTINRKRVPTPPLGGWGVLFLLCSLSVFAQQDIKIIAHRGYWKTEGSAQNSIRALELAHEAGVYGSEFDVHLTADNVLVIFHDDSIQGVVIQDVPYSTIRDFTLSNGEKLPTLEAYLKRSLTLPGLQLIFELKPHQTPERNREAAQASVEMVKRFGLEERTEYITFNLDAGLEFIKSAPNAQVAYLNGELSPNQLKELGFSGLDYHYNVMLKNPEWFDEAKKAGLTINIWTVNNEELANRLIEMGADYITTDNPTDPLTP